MGLLDDAIRDHLDLMRRRGADPAEIQRVQREALGDCTRESEEALDAFGVEGGAPSLVAAGAFGWTATAHSEVRQVEPLDEAIQEHLDLMRRHGACPAEIDRVEHEALGPVRSEPEEPGGPRLEAEDGAGALARPAQRRHSAGDQSEIASPSSGAAAAYRPAARIAESSGSRGKRLARAAALPALTFAIYAGLGWKEVVLQHVVNGDATARMAHAYFVFYNSPPKLAAIGFVWPPLMTVVLLPFAVIKPVATSLLGLPLMSATFATGVVVVLDRTLRLARMRPALRYPLLAAYGLNPMILSYATNGMAEIVSIFFLTVAMHALLSWYLYREIRQVAVLSIALTLGFLSRYELILWLAPAMLVMFGTMLKERAHLNQLGAWLIALVVPIAYGIGIWLFLNWSIMGAPFYWLRAETSSDSTAPLVAHTHPALMTILERVVSLNAHLFFPTLMATAALAIAFVVRRNMMTAGLLLAVTLNGIFSAWLFYLSNNRQYFELRYNMRAISVVIVCIAWFYLMARSQWQRAMLWCISLVALLAAFPFTWQVMATSNLGVLEDAFVHSLPNFRDQTGDTGHILGARVHVGVDWEEGMADYIRRHISGRDVVLTDDALSFGVMLADGRPEVYWDRIDKGDAAWNRVLARPQGKVKYLLVGGQDLAAQRYPGLYTVGTSTSGRVVAGRFQQIYRNPRFILFRVLPKTRGSLAKHVS